ncbi:MAG: hypothetical protein H5T66_15565, partial [Chloroflexi bacterium]|nr:hypothetical protein [Chloroflexota bacterium]
RPVCKSIKENPNITLSYGEIIIKPELCKEARKKEDRERVVPTEDGKVKEEETEPAYAAEGEEKKGSFTDQDVRKTEARSSAGTDVNSGESCELFERDIQPLRCTNHHTGERRKDQQIRL